MTTNRADYTAVPRDRSVESIDKRARRKGVRPIASADDLAQDGVFDTDEELDASRRRAASRRPRLIIHGPLARRSDHPSLQRRRCPDMGTGLRRRDPAGTSQASQ